MRATWKASVQGISVLHSLACQLFSLSCCPPPAARRPAAPLPRCPPPAAPLPSVRCPLPRCPLPRRPTACCPLPRCPLPRCLLHSARSAQAPACRCSSYSMSMVLPSSVSYPREPEQPAPIAQRGVWTNHSICLTTNRSLL